MSGLFDTGTPGRSEHTLQIKDWVRAVFELELDTPVLVTELACSDPGCPPVETVIAVMDEGAKPHKLHKPISQISYADVQSLLPEAAPRPETKEDV